MDRDVEQAADQAAATDPVPTQPRGYCVLCGCPRWAPHSTDHDPQWVTGFFGEAAATDPVPAEAVEAAAKALYEYPETGIWYSLPEARKDKWRDEARIALTAAAPLIVADRDEHINALEKELWAAEDTINRLLADAGINTDTIDRLTAEVADKDGTIHRQAVNARNYVKERDQARAEVDRVAAAAQQDVEECDHCGEEKRVAWWYENGEAAVCGDCHEAELLERDQLRVFVADRDDTITALRADVAASHALVSAARVSMDRLTAELGVCKEMRDAMYRRLGGPR